MQDRNKWAFWSFVLLAAALVCLPSTLLLQALGRYRRFADGVDPSALRPTRMKWVPRESRGGSVDQPRVDFVEFKLKAPKAKTVELIGDFNGWKSGTLALTRRSSGSWEVLLPLPKGRYRYLFVVDGQAELDPGNPAVELQADRKTSVKAVK